MKEFVCRAIAEGFLRTIVAPGAKRLPKIADVHVSS